MYEYNFREVKRSDNINKKTIEKELEEKKIIVEEGKNGWELGTIFTPRRLNVSYQLIFKKFKE